jgi:hypothetical protein
MQTTRIWIAALATAASTAFPVAAAVTPGVVQTFKDWTVGCDNGLDCQAVALMTDQDDGKDVSVVVTRSAGASAALTIDLASSALKPGQYQLRVDGKLVSNAVIDSENQPIKLSGAVALKLLRAMARGNQFGLQTQSGTQIGSASLSGAAAAFRYIDAKQVSIGPQYAILATSGKPKAGKRPSLPVITARKIAPDNVLPDTGALVAFSESSPCAAERFESTQDTAYSLGNGANGAQALVLLNCGAGACNFSSGIYIGTRNPKDSWTFEPAKFDYGATGFGGESKFPILVNAGWDAETQTITSFSKGRGLGDCGSSESYLWDGNMFRLIAASFMGECRGSTDWIPTWRAQVRLTN